jgi:hypothetical protein
MKDRGKLRREEQRGCESRGVATYRTNNNPQYRGIVEKGRKVDKRGCESKGVATYRTINSTLDDKGIWA